MTYAVSSPNEYVLAVDEGRREAFEKLRETIVENIPDGFREGLHYGMIGYAVPCIRQAIIATPNFRSCS
jgi:Na+-transporting NADH:ubiquinone oxidoreductase subunit NqrD